MGNVNTPYETGDWLDANIDKVVYVFFQTSEQYDTDIVEVDIHLDVHRKILISSISDETWTKLIHRTRSSINIDIPDHLTELYRMLWEL